MELKSSIPDSRKNIVALFIFTLFWFSLALISGTLRSGYHFADDHEIIYLHLKINHDGFFQTCEAVIKKDLLIRLRTFFYFHRILETKLFGTNFLVWSVYQILLAIFTSFFLYLFIKRQKYSFTNAVLFVFLTLLGTQSAIFWKLGPAETIGFFMLSAALFFMANSIVNEKKYQLFISVLCLLFSTFSKESFTIFIPAYLLLFILIYQQQHPEKKISSIIKSNIFFVVSTLAIFLIEVIIIKYYVGTNKIGYAGVDEQLSIARLAKFIYYKLRDHYLYLFLIFFGLFLLLQNSTSIKISLIDFKRHKMAILTTIIFFVIIFPQFILYEKSGLTERYLLPYLLGFSISIIFISQQIAINKGIMSLTKKAFIIIILAVIGYFFKTQVWLNAREFTKEGKTTSNFFSAIIDNTKGENDSILIVLNTYENYEMGYSINTYLKEISNRKNITFFLIRSSTVSEFEKILEKQFKIDFKNVVSGMNNSYSCIALLHFLNSNTVKDELYNNPLYKGISIGDHRPFHVFVRK